MFLFFDLQAIILIYKNYGKPAAPNSRGLDRMVHLRY